MKAKARHIIKTQKKTSWQSFCSSLTSKTKPKTVWKAIRKIKGKKSTSSLGHLKVNGKLVTDKKQIANLLASIPQWGAADAEIKVPSGENTELKRSPFQAWSRSVYSHTCYA
ncbi:hypothetical protein, partial [Thiolapillus sp.]|uniref:hypothetical protein n=1 Tax=Thiolapillus sp. TaxID=2017437 RepID=UPI003AF8CC74